MQMFFTKLNKNIDGIRASGPVMILLVLFVIGSFAGYFLFEHGQANNFPTYLTGILVLFLMFSSCDFSSIYKSLILRVLVALLVFICSSLFWSEEIVYREVISTLGNALLILLMVLAVVLCSRWSMKFQQVLLGAFVLMSASSALYFSYGFAVDDLILPVGRWKTISVAAISYGLSLVIAAYLMLSANSNTHRITWGAGAIILLFVSIQLAVPFVWFALVASITLLVFSKLWHQRHQPVAFIWMIVCAIMIGLLLWVFDIVIATERQMIWQSVINLSYEKSPLWGNGVLTAISPYLACESGSPMLEEFGGCKFNHPHNLYVSMIYRYGIAGFSVFLILFTVAISVAYESRNDTRWVVLAMLSYGAAIFLFDGNNLLSKINYVWLIFWLPMGLAIALEVEQIEDH